MDHSIGDRMVHIYDRQHLGILTRPLVEDGVIYIYNRSGILTALKLTQK